MVYGKPIEEVSDEWRKKVEWFYYECG
jgi:hypothetical protein